MCYLRELNCFMGCTLGYFVLRSTFLAQHRLFFKQNRAFQYVLSCWNDLFHFMRVYRYIICPTYILYLIMLRLSIFCVFPQVP